MYNSISSLEDFQLITGRVIAGKIEGSSQISILHDNIEIQKVYKKRFITPIFKMSGCNFGFHRSTINTIGFFDENFGPGAKFKSSDDNEWCYRALHDYCYELIYQPNVVVIHRSWRNLREEEIQFKDYGYSAGVFFRYMLTKSKPDFLIHILQMMSWVISSMLFSSERKRGLQKAYVTEFYKGFRAYVNI
jgi:GT2 family glycosyltransferase